MYATSTQKRYWTYASMQDLTDIRANLNANFINKYRAVIQSDEELQMFITPDEERILCRMVCATGLRFGRDFQPTLPPTVKWMAFMYFKRIFLRVSSIEYSLKKVMVACYFLAAKVDDFFISTRDFVSNLKTETPEANTESLLKLEPKLMELMNYQLTVHTPFRAFEGHMVEMKTRMPLLDFDLEGIREHSMSFFENAQLGDAMLLYAPTHIALAALKYGLDRLDKSPDILKDFFYKFLDLDPWNSREEEKMQVERLLNHVDQIIALVLEQAKGIEQHVNLAVQDKSRQFCKLYDILGQRLRAQQQHIEVTEPTNTFSDSD